MIGKQGIEILCTLDSVIVCLISVHGILSSSFMPGGKISVKSKNIERKKLGS